MSAKMPSAAFASVFFCSIASVYQAKTLFGSDSQSARILFSRSIAMPIPFPMSWRSSIVRGAGFDPSLDGVELALVQAEVGEARRAALRHPRPEAGRVVLDQLEPEEAV